MKKILNRRKIIVETAIHFGFSSYLEIGLRDANSVFNHVPCKVKYSVDIDPKAKPCYCGSSDSFFAQEKIKDVKWDLIFIDGWHMADFVYRDLMNSVDHLNENGVIFLHDVLPTKYEYTLEDKVDCQTAWKVVPYVLKHHRELRICTIADGNAGLGVAVKGERNSSDILDHRFNKFYDFAFMNTFRKISQNTIEYNQLFDWIKNGN